MILRGDLLPGSSIPRRSVAEQLGISFLPVSEALERLEHEGLVESAPRIGTRVRKPTAEDVRGHYVVREALECQAARLYAEHATGEERSELRRLALEIDRAAEVGGDLHDRFHQRVAECGRCANLAALIERTHAWLRLSRAPRQAGRRSHRDLTAVLNSGSAEAAARAMRAHVRRGMEEALAQICS